jgi:hypothetical protein
MTLLLTVGGLPGAIVLGAKYTSGNAIDQAQGATMWRDQAWSNLRGAINNEVTCSGAIVRHVNGLNATVYELGAPTSPAGALTGATPLLAACTLVKWTTATGGRSGKGRTFLPGIPATGIAAGGRTVNSGHVTTTQGAVNAYLASTAMSTYGLKPAVLSFRKGEAYPILAGAVNSIVGLQRRRMR